MRKGSSSVLSFFNHKTSLNELIVPHAIIIYLFIYYLRDSFVLFKCFTDKLSF